MSEILEFLLGILLDVFDVFCFWRCSLSLAAFMSLAGLADWLIWKCTAGSPLYVPMALVGLTVGITWEISAA